MTKQKWCDEILGLFGRHPDFQEMKDLVPIIIGYVGHRYKLVLLWPGHSQEAILLKMEFRFIGRHPECPVGWISKELPVLFIQNVIAASSETNPILSMSREKYYTPLMCTTNSGLLAHLDNSVDPGVSRKGLFYRNRKNVLQITNIKTGVEEYWRVSQLRELEIDHVLPLSRFDLILIISRCRKFTNLFHVFSPTSGLFVRRRAHLPTLPSSLERYHIIRAQIVNDPETEDQFLIALFANCLGTPSLLLSRIQIHPSPPMLVRFGPWFHPLPPSTYPFSTLVADIPVIRAIPEMYL